MEKTLKGPELLRLIPQRNPMVMVDELTPISPSSAQTVLYVRPDNMFVYKNGDLAESGLIEHVAQSAAALAGLLGGVGKALIGEVKHFECFRRPHTGDRITTAINFTFSYAGATMVNGICNIDGHAVARTRLKIFIPQVT